jgi:hypothetical protein
MTNETSIEKAQARIRRLLVMLFDGLKRAENRTGCDSPGASFIRDSGCVAYDCRACNCNPAISIRNG